MDAASLYSKRDGVDFGGLSEMDILQGPWHVLYTSCCWSVVDAHAGELASKASANSKNRNRMSLEERYQIGAKVDGLYLGNSRELGCIEAGRPIKESISKELSDGYLKLPKTLMDMLSQLAKEEGVKADGNRLVTVGFLVMGHRVLLLQMDSPVGYVGRLTRSKFYQFPASAGELPKMFVAIVKLAWSALKTMEATLDFITNKKQSIEAEGIQFPLDDNNNSSNDNNSSILIQPAFHRLINHKKRKTSASS